MKYASFGAVAVLMASVASMAAAEDVEVLHWWTSGGEAAAIGVLKDTLAKEGIGWKDAPVAGGGGSAALTALKARVSSGNPPTAAQISLKGLQEWAAEGLLGDLTPLAEKENWAAVLPDEIKAAAMYEGKWVGVPFNIHRANWMWMNAKVFADNGLTPPATWDEFFAAGDKLKEKGIIPLALGGEPWQETIVFEDLIVAIGGPEFYKQTMMDLNPEALGGEQMVKVFDNMRKLKGYVDPNTPGRVWNDATAMVLNGQAAMQLMGDWAKGEIVNAKQVPGTDILCAPAPGNKGTYLFHGDFFEFFAAKGDAKAAQDALASAIMNPSFQETFNLVKGSIPARMDVPGDKFDACAKEAMTDIKAAIAAGSLLPDVDGGAAQPSAIQGAIQDVVTQHFNSDQSSQDAAAALVRAVQAAQ